MKGRMNRRRGDKKYTETDTLWNDPRWRGRSDAEEEDWVNLRLKADFMYGVTQQSFLSKSDRICQGFNGRGRDAREGEIKSRVRQTEEKRKWVGNECKVNARTAIIIMILRKERDRTDCYVCYALTDEKETDFYSFLGRRKKGKKMDNSTQDPFIPVLLPWFVGFLPASSSSPSSMNTLLFHRLPPSVSLSFVSVFRWVPFLSRAMQPNATFPSLPFFSVWNLRQVHIQRDMSFPSFLRISTESSLSLFISSLLSLSLPSFSPPQN